MKRWFLFSVSVLFLCLLLSLHVGTARCFADDLDGFGDDTLGGFGDDAGDDFGDNIGGFDDLDGFGDTVNNDPWDNSAAGKEEKKPLIPFEIGGSLSLKSMYNVAHDKPVGDELDWRGLSGLRTELKLELEDKIFKNYRWFIGAKASNDFLYGIRRSDEYPEDLIKEREGVVELDKAYIGGRLNDYMDFRFGRQVIVWGKSDIIRVVDVVNPVDNREPGMIDISETRIPLTMTKLDFYIGDWTLNAIAIHEIRFDKIPIWGSDFYPTDDPLPYEERPESTFENTEVAFAFSRLFSGGGMDFYYSNLYNDDFHLESVNNNGVYDPYLAHDRVNVFGFDCNKAVGNFMLKTEMAVWQGVKYFNPAVAYGGELVGHESPRYNRFDILFGFEFMGIKNTMISFDTVTRVIDGFDSVLENSPIKPQDVEDQWVLRISRNFNHETIEAELLLSCYGWNGSDGAFQRFKVIYDVSDRLILTGGVMFYKGGDSIPIETIDDNDRAFLELTYTF